MERKLSTKQKRFIEHYTGNGTEAARLAGYAGNDAVLAQIASENLRKPEIQAQIRHREAEALEPLIADKNDRLRFWSEIMNDKSVELRDRLKASELLAKAGGDFLPKRSEDEGKLTLADIIIGARRLSEEK